MILQQKQLADECLSKLETLDPTCVVAGGAPRDWYRGVPANDIDIFFHLPDTLDVSRVEGLLRGIGFENIHRLGSDYEQGGTSNLKAVWEFMIDEYHTVQLMWVSCPVSSYIFTFPYNVCQVWYKGGNIHMEPVTKAAFKYRVLCKIIDSTPSYSSKIEGYFISWTLCEDYDTYRDILIERLLADAPTN